MSLGIGPFPKMKPFLGLTGFGGGATGLGNAGGVAPYQATGGTETTHGTYKVHSYTSTGNASYQVAAGIADCDILLISGGGGGGGGGPNYGYGGGGGAGGTRQLTSIPSTAGSYTIGVGTGGDQAATGDVSSVAVSPTVYQATGGGGGGPNGSYGKPGGSGGGAGRQSNPSNQQIPGNAGGYNPPEGNNGGYSCGGGGGAGDNAAFEDQDGQSGPLPFAGDGIQNDYRTGSQVWYGGGGASGKVQGDRGHWDGGKGGGGGTEGAPQGYGSEDGQNNTGGGAGSACCGKGGGQGGPGIVVIRYVSQD